MAVRCAEPAPPRPPRRRLVVAAGAGVALAALGACAQPARPGPRLEDFPPVPEAPAGTRVVASEAARAAVARMGRGINFGNMLDAPREGDWGLRVEERFIDLVGEGGFTRSVRLPVRWSNHASPDAAAVIDPAFFARVERIVDRLLARGCTVVLNMHHYRQLDGDAPDPNEFLVEPAVVQVRLLSIWRQIAERFAGRGERLLFEIYNEPHGVLEPHWNTLFSRALATVRRSNPTRAVIVGPVHWNAPSHLDRLVLPPDRDLVVTVHHYEPFDFTHQGAEWIQPPRPTGQDCCDDAQRRAIESPLLLSAQDRERRGFPVFVGEFGAYSRAPLNARLRYLRLKREAMERLGLPWFYWELAAGFGVFDPEAGRFREPLHQALYGG
jgi:endoglucanase